MGATWLPLGSARTMQRVAETDEPHTGIRVRSCQEAGHPPAVGLPADDQAGALLTQIESALSVHGHGRLGLAQWQLDGGGGHPASLQTMDMSPHRGRVAGSSGGQDDAHPSEGSGACATEADTGTL
jgi:hypothetical protein